MVAGGSTPWPWSRCWTSCTDGGTVSLDLLRLCRAVAPRNAPGDAERATARLDEGLALAQEIGVHPLAERVLSRRKQLHTITRMAVSPIYMP